VTLTSFTISILFHCLCGARIRHVRSLSQAFAKLFSRGRQVSVLRAGDAHRDDVIDPGQRSIEQSFSAHVFENRARERDASTSFNLSDERTGAVAFHRDARLDTERTKDAVKTISGDWIAKITFQDQVAAKQTERGTGRKSGELGGFG